MSMSPLTSSIDHAPYLTHDLPGIGGVIKQHAEDFQVDEIAAYPPSGTGEHTFLHIRKTQLDTHQAVRMLAAHFEIHPDTMGWAGLKDKHAVTTQWLSAPNIDPARAQGLELENLVVLQAVRHGHKLRTGHLTANRFMIRVRHVGPEAAVNATRILQHLQRWGVPNYYGEQRFGREGDNIRKALAWVSGVSGAAPAPRSKFERKLLFSALQSHWFNQVLAMRLQRGWFGTAISGDLMRKEDTGGLFVVQNDGAAQPSTESGDAPATASLPEAQHRMNEWAISPTGPMFGARMRQPLDLALALEHEVLSQHGVQPSHLAAFAKVGEGTRRVLRIRPTDVTARLESDGGQNPNTWLTLSFVLPKGAYATVLLRELMKPTPRQPAVMSGRNDVQTP
jgi:tRNA pseudouridine13 synthase